MTPLISAESRSRLGDVLLSDQTVLPEQLAERSTCRRSRAGSWARSSSSKACSTPAPSPGRWQPSKDYPTVDLRTVRPTAEALACVSEEIARQLRIVPLQLNDGTLDVAISDGTSEVVREALTRPEGRPRQHLPRPARRRADEHQHLLPRAVRERRPHQAVLGHRRRHSSEIAAEIGATDEAPIIQLVNKIVTQALRDRASDIHIEPTDGRIRVRYRSRRRATRGVEPS